MACKKDREQYMSKEVPTLSNMRCWYAIERPSNENVLHSKFVPNRTVDKMGRVPKYKVRLAVCKNGQTDSDDETFSPLLYFSAIRLILALAAQRVRHKRHFDFQNSFPNRILGRSIYVELPKHVYTEAKRENYAMKLNRSLYGLRYAACI